MQLCRTTRPHRQVHRRVAGICDVKFKKTNRSPSSAVGPATASGVVNAGRRVGDQATACEDADTRQLSTLPRRLVCRVCMRDVQNLYTMPGVSSPTGLSTLVVSRILTKCSGGDGKYHGRTRRRISKNVWLDDTAYVVEYLSVHPGSSACGGGRLANLGGRTLRNLSCSRHAWACCATSCWAAVEVTKSAPEAPHTLNVHPILQGRLFACHMMTGVRDDTPQEAWNRCFGEGSLSDLNLEFAHELFLYAAMSNDPGLVHWCLQELPMSTKPAQRHEHVRAAHPTPPQVHGTGLPLGICRAPGCL